MLASRRLRRRRRVGREYAPRSTDLQWEGGCHGDVSWYVYLSLLPPFYPLFLHNPTPFSLPLLPPPHTPPSHHPSTTTAKGTIDITRGKKFTPSVWSIAPLRNVSLYTWNLTSNNTGGHLAFRAAFDTRVAAAVCYFATDIHSHSLGAGKDDDSLQRAGEIRGEVIMVSAFPPLFLLLSRFLSSRFSFLFRMDVGYGGGEEGGYNFSFFS